VRGAWPGEQLGEGLGTASVKCGKLGQSGNRAAHPKAAHSLTITILWLFRVVGPRIHFWPSCKALPWACYFYTVLYSTVSTKNHAQNTAGAPVILRVAGLRAKASGRREAYDTDGNLMRRLADAHQAKESRLLKRLGPLPQVLRPLGLAEWRAAAEDSTFK
jgi:hypothetical protein